MKQIIFVEDGSVDVFSLQAYVGNTAYVCVVRQGARFPVSMAAGMAAEPCLRSLIEEQIDEGENNDTEMH